MDVQLKNYSQSLLIWLLSAHNSMYDDNHDINDFDNDEWDDEW